MVNNITWTIIKNKLRKRELIRQDLENTELGLFVDEIFNEYYGAQFRKIELNSILENLLNLPIELPQEIYAIFDMGDIGSEEHKPIFMIIKRRCFLNSGQCIVLMWMNGKPWILKL